MTKIRAKCPTCGDVEFGIDAIVVLGSGVQPTSTYRFCCPSCHDAVSRAALPDVIELLISVGVRVEDPTRTASGSRPAPGAPPLNDRDLDDFAALLRRPDWFTKLEALTDLD